MTADLRGRIRYVQRAPLNPPGGSSMPRVVALYRHPIKGFTPESCERLVVLPSGRIAGDRVLGVRFADTAAADEAWSPKAGMLVLMNTPGLARLEARYDDQAGRLELRLDGQ